MVTMLIENVPVRMELVSAAGIFDLPKELILLKLKHAQRYLTFLKLKIYNGSVIKSVKAIFVKVKCSEKQINCKLFVIQKGCQPLLGRYLLEIFCFKFVNAGTFLST